jgi:transposase
MGLRVIAKKYGIKSYSHILLWIHRYKIFDLEGLNVLTSDKIFDGSFKLSVLKWMKTNEASYPKTALHFNISNIGTIWQWQHV